MPTELTIAIDRSKQYDRIVPVEYEGDHTDLLIALDGIVEGEIDSAVENEGEIDVWGSGWRLLVTLV